MDLLLFLLGANFMKTKDDFIDDVWKCQIYHYLNHFWLHYFVHFFMNLKGFLFRSLKGLVLLMLSLLMTWPVSIIAMLFLGCAHFELFDGYFQTFESELLQALHLEIKFYLRYLLIQEVSLNEVFIKVHLIFCYLNH